MKTNGASKIDSTRIAIWIVRTILEQFSTGSTFYYHFFAAKLDTSTYGHEKEYLHSLCIDLSSCMETLLKEGGSKCN